MRLRSVLFAGTTLLALGLSRAARAEDEGTILLPVARVMFGPAFHVGASPLVQFLLDADVGTTWLLQDMRIYVDAELGYTYDHEGLHAFNAMAGIGYGRAELWYVAYQPRLLLGTLNDEFTVGLRNGVGGHFFSDMFDVEVGHQFLSTSGKLSQSIIGTIGINPAAVIYLFVDSVND